MMGAKKDMSSKIVKGDYTRTLTITTEHHDRGCADVMLITF